MGFKIKIKAPKIKIGDPTKLITKPIEGIQNAAGSVVNNALDNVGKAMSNPAAAPLLAAGATAFGGPEAGLLAGNLASSFQKKMPTPAPTYSDAIASQNFPDSPTSDNKKLYIGLGAGAFVLVIVAVLFLKKKGK